MLKVVTPALMSLALTNLVVIVRLKMMVIKSISRSHIDQQSGLSLIELLIALALSALIMLAAIQLLIIQMHTAQLQEGLSGVLENGQFGLQFIRDEVQLAGGNDPYADPIAPVVWHLSADGAQFDRVTLQRRLSTQGDQLCTGAATPASSADENARVVWSEYSVQADTTRAGVFQLVCSYRFPGRLATANDTFVPAIEGRGIIIDGIDHLQILYGVVPLTQPFARIAQHYLPRAQVNPLQDRVVDIKLAVLLHSESSFALTTMNRLESAPVFAVLDQQITALAGGWLDDRRLHRSFTLWVPLKQRLQPIGGV